MNVSLPASQILKLRAAQYSKRIYSPDLACVRTLLVNMTQAKHDCTHLAAVNLSLPG